MTLIQSLRRPMKRKNRRAASRSFRCESLESRRLLALTVTIPQNIQLLPETPGQVVELSVSSQPGDRVTGMVLSAQLGDGAGGADEPLFTDVSFSGGTVWDLQAPAYVTTPNPLTDAVLEDSMTGDPLPYLDASLTLGDGTNGPNSCAFDPNTGMAPCDFAPSGVFVKLTIDTTGFSSGTFPLLLNGGDDPTGTQFLQAVGIPVGSTGTFRPEYPAIALTVNNGSITISNTPPVSDPGPGYVIDFGDSLDLDGSASFDPDESLGDSITDYSWDINSNTFVTADATGEFPTTLTWSQLNGLGINAPGTYPVTLQVTDSFSVTHEVSTTITVNPTTITSRNILYNNSSFDGNGAVVTTADLSAVSITKTPLVGGGTPAFANFSSYSLGLNGVVIAVSNIPNVGSIDATDFEVRIGGQGFGNDDPANWIADTNTNPGTGQANLVPVVTVLENVSNAALGLTGEDVIALTWGNNVIEKQWAEVTMLANGDTGLATPNRFYFGNLVGDNNGDFFTDPGDVIRVNNNQTGFFDPPPTIDNLYDIDHSGFVDPGDLIKTNNNQSGFFDYLSNTIVPRSESGSFAPFAAPPEGEAVALRSESEPDSESVSLHDVCFASPAKDSGEVGSSSEGEEPQIEIATYEDNDRWFSAIAAYVAQQSENTRSLRATALEADDVGDWLDSLATELSLTNRG